MKNSDICRFATAMPFVFAAAVAAAQIPSPYVRASASARYQGDDGGTTTNQVNFPVASLPGFTTAHVLVPVGGATGYGRPGRDTAFDDAEAFARSTMPGTLGAYARSGGYSPGHMPSQDFVVSKGVAEKVANWRADLPGHTSANVNLSTFLDGWMYTSSNAGLSQFVEAKFAVELLLITQSGTSTIFSVNATLNLQTGFSTNFMTIGGSSNATWNASWSDTSASLTSRNGHDFMWDLNYQELFPGLITIPLNEDFATKATMTIEANNNEGPFEIFATSDFSHSGDFNLTTDNPDMDLRMINLVPEPATMSAFAIGALVLCRRKLRRGRS